VTRNEGGTGMKKKKKKKKKKKITGGVARWDTWG
jgi:hypothetical protein